MRFNQDISQVEYSFTHEVLKAYKSASKSHLRTLDDLSRLASPAIRALRTVTLARGHSRFHPIRSHVADFSSSFEGNFYFFDKHARSRLVQIGMDHTHIVITNHKRIKNKKNLRPNRK